MPLDCKWSCEYCTYANYPSAAKCTMCRAPRPLYVVHQPAPAPPHHHTPSPPLAAAGGFCRRRSVSPASSVDEFAVPCTGSSAISSAITSSSSGSGCAAGSGKWACVACTFLNWPHDSTCLQCDTPRRFSPAAAAAATASPSTSATTAAVGNNSARASSVDSLSHRLSASCSLVSGGGGGSCGLAVDLADCRRRSVHATRSPPPPSSNNRSHSPLWTCVACTYDNSWTAGRCVMCERARPIDAVSSLAPVPPPPPPAPVSSCSSTLLSNNYEVERRARRLRRRQQRDGVDWPWLNACAAAVDGHLAPVLTFLDAGGDPARQLTRAEVMLLNQPGTFDPGVTLVHLAIRYCQDYIVDAVLSRMTPVCGSSGGGGGSAVKRPPCLVAAELATTVRRAVANSLRQKKVNFCCHFVTDMHWLSLPYEIVELSSAAVQQQLWHELLDQQAQCELEESQPPAAINWSGELCDTLGCRLLALWNRTAGDCLLDSVMQAMCGVFDRQNSLRRAVFDSLHDAANCFYPRWRENELLSGESLHYGLCDEQLASTWRQLLSLSKPGAALEQLHVWTLAHVIRRPIIVYGVKYVKSFRGETIDLARFQGVYLPMLWDVSFCSKWPICLGYTRGHFSALVTIQQRPPSPRLNNPGASFHSAELGGGGGSAGGNAGNVVYYPLVSQDGKLLPVHFITRNESGCEERLLRRWMDVIVTDGGYSVARAMLPRPPLMVAQMMQEWLNHYRSLCLSCGPVSVINDGPVMDDITARFNQLPCADDAASSENDSGAE